MALAPTYAAHRLLPAAAGAHTLEVFLDYTCPFSAKIWRRLTKDVIPYLASAEPKVAVVFRHQVQPWHPASTLLHEASLAVEKINPSAFSLYSTALFEHQHEFFDEATLAASVNAVDDTLAVLQLLDIQAGEPKNGGNAVTNDLKYHIKLARAQGIHVSPTVVFDGIRDDGVSSSWTLEQWKAWLAPRL
ncbi:hypothetical protein DL89DRAFT_327425 [Linderina pennispora]|uniref:Thioredoxin-like fold domain-containing protein n=1 Tax=Linderina pennispora TaxID=61395 RepID=A0A1Y1VQZ2_9FUNG|nr:uncharacterized protein DL89DRAFT_327425 [Linderina pennispora]ORX63711.1 hypothetical protein DL89DRAFT_327425 [Linderina pennispora]